MKQIFRDYEEIKDVIYTIEQEWSAPYDPGYPPRGKGMRVAKRLADELRQELLGHGGAIPEQLIDPNEIIYYYQDVEVFPDTWQYTFAECLTLLLTHFDASAGLPSDPKDRLYLNNLVVELEKACVAVLHADLSRLREYDVKALAPLAMVGKKHSLQQAKRARKPRSRLTAIIQALMRQNPETSAKELWPHLYSALDEKGLNPTDIDQIDKWRYEYDNGDESRKRITFSRFATIVSNLKSR
jgi:hypothetical protein